MRGTEPSPFARALYGQFQATYLYEPDDPLGAMKTEPAIDQTILDEILQRRVESGEEAGPVTPSWTAADEQTLARRISGSDYPARTAEELLEKIEAAGAAGVGFGMADDVRWQGWVAGGVEDVGRMLDGVVFAAAGVVGRRRKWTRGAWVAAENLATLVAARGRPGLECLTGGGVVEMAWEEIPPALLETALSQAEARRVVVEQC